MSGNLYTLKDNTDVIFTSVNDYAKFRTILEIDKSFCYFTDYNSAIEFFDKFKRICQNSVYFEMRYLTTIFINIKVNEMKNNAIENLLKHNDTYLFIFVHDNSYLSNFVEEHIQNIKLKPEQKIIIVRSA